MRRVAVLASGGGSNLAALLDAQGPQAGYGIVGVACNVPGAFALTRAERAGAATASIDHRGFASREAFEAEVDRALRSWNADLVCLAGFMRVLTAGFVERWQGRMLNIHPSLLPSFRGLHTHRRALEASSCVHGCTVHLVRPELDDGPILVQGVVPVLPDDDAETLRLRVLELEHVCYPRALSAFARGRLRLEGSKVVGEEKRLVLHNSLRERC